MTALNRTALRDAGADLTGGVQARPIRIVHLGLGAFFRAHQAWYTYRVDDAGEWGISAYTGRSPRAAEELSSQDCLYTLLEREADGDTAQIVPVISAAHPAHDLEALREDLMRPSVSVVTLTITEAGYMANSHGDLDESQESVRKDREALRGGSEGAVPPLQTALARLAWALNERRRAGGGPLTVVPCDNLPGNGPLTRCILDAYANDLGPEAAAWIAESVSVASTSIDRITPKSTEEDRARAEELTGYSDASPVVTEPFSSWIIEGDFLGERPQWEKAGAIFTDDLEPFENRKLWLLNGAHTLMANYAANLGHETVAEAMADAQVRTHVEALWDEACRYLPPHVDAAEYRDALVQRFENPRIKHLLAQIGNDSLTKLRVRIVPIALKELAGGRDAAGAAAAIGGWVRRHLDGVASPDALDAQISAALAEVGARVDAGAGGAGAGGAGGAGAGGAGAAGGAGEVREEKVREEKARALVRLLEPALMEHEGFLGRVAASVR